MVKKTEVKPKMKKKIMDRTTIDVINKNLEKIMPKKITPAREKKIKQAYINKFESYNIKKGKTEAETLMNMGRIALQTRRFIEDKIKKNEL